MKEAAVAALPAGEHQYAPLPGVPALREAVLAHQRDFYGLEPVMERIGKTLSDLSGSASTLLGPDGKPSVARVGAWAWGPGHRCPFLVTGEESRGSMFALDCAIGAGGGPPPNRHLAEDELFYVFEGSVSFRWAMRPASSGPGSPPSSPGEPRARTPTRDRRATSDVRS